MLHRLPQILINSLLITLAVELLLAFILRVKDRKDYLNIALVNIVTNLLVVFFPFISVYYLGHVWYYILLFIFEVYAVVFEGFIYKKYLNYKKINPYLLSLMLNIASYSMGLLINNFIY